MHPNFEDFLRVTAVPAAYVTFYAIKGPVDGAVRGITGHNTPIDYTQLAKSYPHKAPLTGRFTYQSGDERDPVSAFGAAWSVLTGTVTSAPTWALARGITAAYRTILPK